MVTVGPSISGILKGIFLPSIPEGGLISTIALIGTTLIGINLILHSVTTKAKWNTVEELENAKFDILVNVLIGGLITVSIVITSAAVLYGTGTEVNSPLVFSKQLEPFLGDWARIVGGLGILAAGLSSAIAVPFTLNSVFSSMFNWKGGIQSIQAKFSLPFIAILLVVATNNKKLLGKHTNTLLQNILGAIAAAVSLGLGVWGLYGVFMKFFG